LAGSVCSNWIFACFDKWSEGCKMKPEFFGWTLLFLGGIGLLTLIWMYHRWGVPFFLWSGLPAAIFIAGLVGGAVVVSSE
jgi:hypothetical protein